MNDSLRSSIRIRLETQTFAVLSTSGRDGPPHSTIVCFVTADELESLVFVTPRTTRKYANLIANPEATMFIDDRTLFLGDLADIWGIEARGRVRDALPAEIDGYRNLFIRKYPALAEFTSATSSAWCVLEVHSYDVVHRFQEVERFFPGGQP